MPRENGYAAAADILVNAPGVDALCRHARTGGYRFPPPMQHRRFIDAAKRAKCKCADKLGWREAVAPARRMFTPGRHPDI